MEEINNNQSNNRDMSLHTLTETQQLRIKQLDLLYANLPSALVSTAIATIILCIIIYKSVPALQLITWLSVYLILILLRFLKAKKYPYGKVSFEKTGLWINLYMLGTGGSGLMLGILPYLIETGESLYYFLITILWISGIAAAAIVHQAVLVRVFFAFSLPIMVPFTIYLVTVGDSNYYFLVAGQLLFYSFLIINIVRVNKTYAESIKLQFNNTELLHELNLEKNRVNALNDELKQDLRERIEMEDELRDEKGKVEDMAKKLLMLSSQDGLTGIANRRHFDEFLAKEWGRSARASSPLSLIICDIDAFKNYNDHYGHQEGDRCLCRIASILAEHARRGGDLAARYGGEEFAIILSDTNIADAVSIAKQIHQAINLQAIPHAASDVDNIITVSFGVATIIPEKDIPSSLLISRADKALYKAKQNGRNQVVAAELESVDNKKKTA